MRKILNILVYLVLLYAVYIAVANFGQSIVLQLGAVKGLAEAGLPVIDKTLPVGVVILSALIVGWFASALIFGQFYMAQKDKLTAYKRELEKSSVSNSTSSSKVEVLEAKIATLEKALDNALNKD